jgi:hypothetical protein
MRCPLLLGALLLQAVPAAWAAHSASNHELLLQHAWHKFEEKGDWSDWEATWAAVDHDDDNKISVGHGEITKLFKIHYNILHEKLEHDKKAGAKDILFRASEQTFRREAEAFLDYREARRMV